MSKKDLTAQLRVVVSSITDLRSEVSEHYASISSALTRLAVLVHSGAELETARGGDWKDWAVSQCHGFGRDGADLAPPTVYRLRNAGAVAAILGDAIGNASYLALVPLYRFIASAKTEAELETARTAIGAIWAEAVKGARNGTPTAEAVLALVEKKNGQGGTRGKKGQGAKGRAETQSKKNARSRNTPTETTETKDVETDPGARDACRAAVLRVTKDVDAETAVATYSVMLAAVKLCETHSLSVTDAILREELKNARTAVRKNASK